jgi:hypothetical protein
MTFAGKSLTKADLERRAAIHAGHCMACIQRKIDMRNSGYVQWHHTAGKKRHDLTCGLCYWHHQGGADVRKVAGRTAQQVRPEPGRRQSKPFHAEFGSNASLLERQNELLHGKQAA